MFFLASCLFLCDHQAMKVQLPPDSTLQPVLGLKMFVQSACSVSAIVEISNFYPSVQCSSYIIILVCFFYFREWAQWLWTSSMLEMRL